MSETRAFLRLHVSKRATDQSTRIMTENKPPSENQTASTSNANQPGRPYYESLRTTLRGTLDKKRKLDEQLAALEEQIFKLEGAYLEETSNSGNIVRGFDGWVKGVSVGGRAGDDRRRGRVRDEDRVFSRSSVGWMRVSLLKLSASLRLFGILRTFHRRKKAQIPTLRHTPLRRPARFQPLCRVQRAPPVTRAKLETKRSGPLIRTMTMKRPQNAARLHTPGTRGYASH